MRKRKRHTLQPMLEPMESRVVPSVVGIHTGQVRVVAAQVAQMNKPAKPAKASQRANNEALRELKQQENLVREHAREKYPSALPTKAEQEASAISNFFQPLESAL